MSKAEMSAYVTMLTDDSFFPGVKALHSSLLSTNTLVPLIIMVTRGVSLSTRSSLKILHNCIIKIVDVITCTSADSDVITTNKVDWKVSWKAFDLTKLNCWNLVEYSKVIYIDADCIVLESVDHLFEISTTFAAAPDVFPPDKFNAGVMVIVPNRSVYYDMLRRIDDIVSYDNGDTGFLNLYFKDWFSSNSTNSSPVASRVECCTFE